MKLNRNKSLFGFWIVVFVFCAQTSFAQHYYFVESGKIEFEKKVNMYAKLKSRIVEGNFFAQKLYDGYLKDQPQFITSKSTLSFSAEKSIYQFIEEEKQGALFMGSEPWLAIQNTIYGNFKTDSMTAVRKVYGEDFVVEESKPTILWKITNEVREIAGYQCKRANGLILDSIYVVAFYSEEIIPSGGPESFSGLPGMILGVALPHENVTWFATKVEINKPISNTQIQIPRRAKQMTRKQYEDNIKKSMKGRGEDALKAFML